MTSLCIPCSDNNIWLNIIQYLLVLKYIITHHFDAAFFLSYTKSSVHSKYQICSVF